MKNYVGQKIKGFKFKNGTDSVPWLKSKKDFIGIVGKIINQEDNYVIVNFEDSIFQGLAYPISMIENYLLLEDPKLLKKGDKILVSDDDGNWKERIFLAYIEELRYPVICVHNLHEELFRNGKKIEKGNWKFWKPLPEKIKLTKQEVANKLGISIENLEIVE